MNILYSNTLHSGDIFLYLKYVDKRHERENFKTNQIFAASVIKNTN